MNRIVWGAALVCISVGAHSLSYADEPSTRTLPRAATEHVDVEEMVTGSADVQDVLCRDAWGAKPPYGEYQPHTVSGIMLHHTGVPLLKNSKAPSRVRSAQVFHQHGPDHQYVDVAYHFLVDRDGNVYEGRPPDARGDTSTGYNPSGYLLVGVMGDLNQHKMTDQQMEGLVKLLAWASQTYNVAPEAIVGHNQRAKTSCPGQHLRAVLEDTSLARQVRERLEKGGVKVRRLCGEQGKTRIAAIAKSRR